MPKDSPLSLIGMSCISDMRWTAGFGLSGPATLLIGIAIETVRPLRTSARGRGDLVGRDVVERAALVVGTPAAPVLDRLEHRVELGQRDGRCGRRRALGPGDARDRPDPGRSLPRLRPPTGGAVAARMVSTLSAVTKMRPESPMAGSGFCSQWSMPRLRMMSLWKV